MTAPFRHPDIEVPVRDLGEMTLKLTYDVSGHPYARASHPDGPSRGTGWEIAPRLKGGHLQHQYVPGKVTPAGLWLDCAQIERLLNREHMDALATEAVERVRVGA